MVQLQDPPAVPTRPAHRADGGSSRPDGHRAPPPTQAELELGVIEEARRRRRRRRLSMLLALSLLAGLVAGLLVGVGAGAREPASLGRGQPAPRFSGGSIFSVRARRHSVVAVLPALGAGEVGWIDYRLEPDGSGGGGCCGLLTHTAQVNGVSRSGGQRYWTAEILTAPGVAFVSADGGRLVRTRSYGLPYGLRAASVKVPDAAVVSPAKREKRDRPGAAQTGRQTIHTPRVTAYDARRRVIRIAGFETQPKRHFFEGPYAPKHWKAPASPSPGACELSLSGLSSATPIRGATVARVKGYRSFGPAFQSCVDTEYALAGSHLEAAVLIDAQRPGSRPAALPYMRPLRGYRGVYQEPTSPFPPRGAHTPRFLLAVRIAHAWVVVTGGRDAAQSLRLLRHLRARVAL
jgi:hypothetical protein